MFKLNNNLIVCVVRVWIVFVLIKKIKCSEEEERLVKSLFKGYNKLIRPVRNASDHVVVTLDLFLLQLINVVCFLFFVFNFNYLKLYVNYICDNYLIT